MSGTLILCAGPIGNLSDAPPRLAEALREADVVYAEDTRRARTLLSHLGVAARTRSYHVANEQERARELADHLAEGHTVALLTDAGTPAISDPGLSAVRAAVDVGARVTAVPGPSAVTTAVALSGLPADRFLFTGFLPRRGEDRSSRIAEVAGEAATVVFFAAPGRLAADFADLLEAHGSGERECVVCREMTKVHEEVWRGTLADAVEEWSGREVKGEVTVVLGPVARVEPDIEEAVASALSMIEGGMSPSRAVRKVAEETGVSRRALYERVAGAGRER